jgi:MEMO1 family protein
MKHVRIGVVALVSVLMALVAARSEDEPVAVAAGKPELVIRSSLAGTWYAADQTELRREVKRYLDGAAVPSVFNAIAMIVPHAGYRFSGAVAAHAYAAVRRQPYKRVVILGPTHRVRLPGVASVPEATHYETPLGRIAVDTGFVARLRKSPRFVNLPAAHEGEHSVEIQMPFIQIALPTAAVVPVVVGQLDEASLKDLAKVLRAEMDRDTLVIASSDFTHYGPNYDYVPFAERVPENIEKLDKGALAFIEKKDAKGFLDYCDRTGATICGRDDIAVLLAMLPEAGDVRLLKYDTSGRITGDFGNSVSYMAVALMGAWAGPGVDAAEEAGTALSDDDKRSLLKLARESLKYYLEHGREPTPQEVGVTVTAPMKQEMGAFVTLKERRELRGCIGEILARRPLYEVVIGRTIDAAVNDSRFLPVQPNEFDKLTFEISALEPPRPVASYRDIEVGRHGILLTKSGASAVFLPQVATEQGWGLEETLAHLALKAGLPTDAWKEGASFQVFEATVFGEEHP